MKVRYNPAKNLQFEFDAETTKGAFKELAVIQEIFKAEDCGVCHGPDTEFIVRHVDDNDYYEKKCQKCGSRLAFGQAKKGGGLFPKRKLDDGTFDRENRGWSKWTPNQLDEDTEEKAPAPKKVARGR